MWHFVKLKKCLLQQVWAAEDDLKVVFRNVEVKSDWFEKLERLFETDLKEFQLRYLVTLNYLAIQSAIRQVFL